MSGAKTAQAGGRRRRAHARAEAPENHERWLITYADLITLLMVFFVVLYSMANSDKTKFQAVSAALERAFNANVLSGGAPTPLSNDNTGAASTPVQELFVAPEDHQTEAARLRNQIQSILAKSDQNPDVEVYPTHDGVAIRLSGSFLFESGRAELKPNALPILEALSAELRLMGNLVRVDGHTDDVPTDSPRYPTNWELSTARATAVTRYLAEIGGVQASRLSAVGYGEFRPLVPNDTRAHRALNRRVEIHILAKTNWDGGARGA